MHAKIKKRDGRLVKFNAEKITNAIAKAGAATGDFDLSGAKMLTIRVLNLADKVFDNRIINVEEIQDIVEEVLLSCALALDLREALQDKIALLKTIPNYQFRYIHADVGEVGQTKEMVKEVTGIIRGNGFEIALKPRAFAASNVADRFS